jgi:hypothetical protein
VDRCLKLLMTARPPLVFQRGGLLVRLARLPTQQHSERESLEIVLVDKDYMQDLLSAWFRWQKETSRGVECIDCPPAIAKAVLARLGDWNAPTLRAVLRTPTLREDGSVLQEPGYDESSGLYLDVDAGYFAPVAEDPTRRDALEALAVLKDVFSEFPFECPEDLSVILAAVVTVMVRPLLRTAPLICVTAPRMAAGKTLLVRAVSLIATGRAPEVMPPNTTEEEERKRVLAVLLSGHAVASIDNVESAFGSATLCGMLTEAVFSDRILGASRVVSVPTTSTTWFATGNNLTVSGDLTTRVLVCRIDPKTDHPEQRTFHRDLDSYVASHRAELVHAALVILRAYHCAGRAQADLPRFGRFEGWSDLVRQSLVWLGEADPCLTRRRAEALDPVSETLRELLVAWHDRFGNTTRTAGEVVTSANGSPGGALASALEEVCGDHFGKLSSRRLGRFLGRYEDRIEAGLVIKRNGARAGVAHWRVESTEEAS